jgi:hypothetical protein
LSAGTVCMRIMLLAFRKCMLPPSATSSNYHKPWNINIFLSTSYQVLPEFPFSFPSCKTLQNSWDWVHMGTWYHRPSWRCTRTSHRVLFRWCWTVSDSADTARPPSAVRCRLVWGIAGRLQRFRGITTRSLQGVEQTDSYSGHGADRQPCWHWTDWSLHWTQWRTQDFFRVGVQQIQLRTEDRENGDLEAVAP